MMASRVTPLAAAVKGAKEEGGTIEATRSVLSTHGHFSRSWASLRQTKSALMALMV